METAHPAAARPACARCLRPASACICAAARPVAHAAQVLILVHPLEVRQAKGTAQLLHLCLPHSRIAVGETFEPAALQQWLAAPWDEADRQAPRRALLLYPPSPAAPGQPVAPAPAPPAHWLLAPERLRLVVLDGTWRKSRKMLWCNPALQALARLSLHAPPPSRYAIRKHHAPHQRSTLEAVHQALVQLEPGNATLHALQDALQTFVRQHQQRQQHPGGGAAASRSAMLDDRCLQGTPAFPEESPPWPSVTPSPT